MHTETELPVSVVNHVATLVGDGKLTVVGVDGCEGAGKSMFAQRLSDHLLKRGISSIVVSIDDFCMPRQIRYGGSCDVGLQVYNHNFNDDQFLSHILLPASHAGHLEYSFMSLNALTDKYETPRHYSISAPGVVIIEGIHLFKKLWKRYYDCRVMLTITEKVQMERAYNRDPSRGNSRADIDYKYDFRYRPSYRHYVNVDEPYSDAHWIIDNTNWNTPVVLQESLP